MTGNENIHWQRIIELPLGLRHFIGILISVVPAFLGWYWIILPLSEVKEQRQDELTTTCQTTETYQQKLADYSTFASFQYRLHLLNLTLQQYQEIDEPINLITDILAESGSKLIDIKKLPSVNKSAFTVFRWNIKAQADYFQFMSFIQLMNMSTHIITFERLTIVGDSQLNLDMTVHLHQLKRGLL